MLPFIVGNWKMNGSAYALLSFCVEMKKRLTGAEFSAVEAVICPPFTMLSFFADIDVPLAFGAQDCHHEKSGAYTGAISVDMIAELDCTHVIVGHSERRMFCGDTDDRVQLKAQRAIDAGLHPIICIGETLSDRETHKFAEVLLQQCDRSLPKSGEYTIAYEPVWAIGKNATLNTDVIRETIDVIAAQCSGRIIYGGSVNKDNAAELMKISNISGLLVGGASLDAEHFSSIIKNVAIK